MHPRTWTSPMSESERTRGFVFLLLYLFLFPRVNGWAQQMLVPDAETMPAEANVIYYGFLFILAVMVFWSFLKEDFTGLLDWLPENLAAVAGGLLIAGGFHIVLNFISVPVPDPIHTQYAQEYLLAPGPTLALLLLLIPVVEEVAYRGILYGALRAYSAPLAGVVSTVAYALANVWRYALEAGDPRLLLTAVLYLPMGAALTWCYDHGGSVWATALLHGAINAGILILAL